MRSMRLQLLLSHLLIVVVLGLAMGQAIKSFVDLSDRIGEVVQGNVPGLTAVQDMRQALDRQQGATLFFLSGNQPLGRTAYSTATADFSTALKRFAVVAQNLDSPSLVDTITDESRSLQIAMERLLGSNKPLGQAQQAEFIRSVRPALDKVQTALTAALYEEQTSMVRANRGAKADALAAATRSVYATVIALACALALSVLTISSTLTPLRQLSAQAERIGSGELGATVDLQRPDEIGALASSFNAMAIRLTEMHEIEEARILRAEKMTDAALDSLYDPVIVSDARGYIVYLNKAAERLFGPAPANPRPPVIEHIGDQRIARAIQRAVTEDRTQASEDETALVPIRVEGAERTYRLRAAPMRDAGVLLGSVAVLEDITHLRELDRLKTEFIGVAAHELRTPVTSLMLGVQLLHEGATGKLTSEQTDIVSALREDLSRLERLMTDLLDLTRLGGGSMEPRLADVDPREIVNIALRSSLNAAENKGVHLSASVQENLPRVQADPTQIGRALSNLVDNAVRHTDAGNDVLISARANADQVTFSVEDQGEGIPQEYLATIFDRFVQVPGATHGGVGLGLSIAQSIIQAHGGQMSATSELGKGSEFSFALRANSPQTTGETTI